MLSQESLGDVTAIIEDHEAALSETIADAAQTREQLAAAEVAALKAEAAAKAADQGLAQAQQLVRDLKSKEQSAESATGRAAKDIAIKIADDPGLDPLTKTFYSLVYSDHDLVWQHEPDAFATAAARGRVALSSITERLRTGEPVLVFRHDSIIADVANEQSLVATPPTIDIKSNAYVSLDGGSIDVVLPEASSAKATKQGLVSVERGTAQATLMSDHYEYGVDRLEAAASNEQWLVVGGEAIVLKLEQLDPIKRLVALTALKAVEVEVPFELEDEIRQATEDHLISLIAFLASGAGQETTTHSATSRDIWNGSSYRTQVTKDTPLTAMAKNVDLQSVRYTALAIGLTKETLRENIKVTLSTRIKQDTTAIDQAAKDIRSLANVDQLLDAIF
jgi:hypothetical protein